MKVPRLRVFAGPNGSGKSTMKSAIPHHLIGIYINPDEIEKTANESGLLSFRETLKKTSRFWQNTRIPPAEFPHEADDLR